MSDDPSSPQAIGNRLRLTRRALGKTTTKMCELMGSSSGGSAWSNYEVGRRVISYKQAIIVCRELHLTMDWIYLGDPSGLPPDLQRVIRELQTPRKRRG